MRKETGQIKDDEKKNGIQTADVAIAATRVGIAATPFLLHPGNPIDGFLAVVAVGATEAFSIYCDERKKARVNQVFEKVRKWFYSLPSDKQEEVLDRFNQSRTEYSNLFEEAREQAARAYTQERLLAISSILVGGLEEEKRLAFPIKFLNLLSSIDDLELKLILTFYRITSQGKRSDEEEAADKEFLKIISDLDGPEYHAWKQSHNTLFQKDLARQGYALPTNFGMDFCRHISKISDEEDTESR